MGSGGFILGGLLAGVGKGITDDVLERRRIALEDRRAANDAAAAEIKSTRDLANAKTMAEVNAGFKRDEIAATGAETRATEQFKTGNTIKIETVKGIIELKKVGAEVSGKKELAVLQSSLDTARDAAKSAGDTARETAITKLKGELDNGQVKSSTPLEDGTFLIVYNDGSKQRTEKIGLPAKTSGGDDSDPIGGRAGRGATPAAASTTATPPGKPTPQRLPKLPKEKWDEYKAQAATMRVNGAVGFKGLTDEQLMAKVRDMVRQGGYDPPQ